MSATAADPRTLWEAVERYHQLCYWAPEVRETGAAAGLKGFWMNYFATRVAPIGAVPAEVAESLVFYYSPARVSRAIPDAWRFATPEAVVAARYEGIDAALRRELGDVIDAPEIDAALTVVRAAVDAVDTMGFTLAAGWRSLEWPHAPHLALWHGCTVLREVRSGAHLVALRAEGLDGCESVVSQVAVDQAPREWIEDEAGWTPDEAAAATERLRERGWIDDAGRATEAGRAGRAGVEAATDRLDSRHWQAVGADACGRLLDALAPINRILPKDDQLDWRELYDPNP